MSETRAASIFACLKPEAWIQELQKEVQHPAFVKEAGTPSRPSFKNICRALQAGVMTLSNAGHLAHKAAQMLRLEPGERQKG